MSRAVYRRPLAYPPGLHREPPHAPLGGFLGRVPQTSLLSFVFAHHSLIERQSRQAAHPINMPFHLTAVCDLPWRLAHRQSPPARPANAPFQYSSPQRDPKRHRSQVNFSRAVDLVERTAATSPRRTSETANGRPSEPDRPVTALTISPGRSPSIRPPGHLRAPVR